MKALRELGDYTKIPIANPRIRNRIPRFPGQFNNSFGRGYLNSGGPVGRQGGGYKTPVWGRGRSYPGPQCGAGRGYQAVSEVNFFFKSANQKQELPVVAMFVQGSGRN